MRDDLLGYLLGALEPEQERAIEARLETDEQLRQALREHRRYLLPLAHDDGLLDAPRGLARRVCDTIADGRDTPTLSDPPPPDGKTRPDGKPSDGRVERTDRPAQTPQVATVARRADSALRRKPAASAVASAIDPPAPSERRWGWAEAVTVGSIVTAASLLIVPALSLSRYRSQIEACRERMHHVGTALVNYSRTHAGLFPEVAPQGPLSFAGVYAARLRDAGLVDDLADLRCPGQAAAAPFADDAHGVTLQELQTADEHEARRRCAQLAGSYGYALGYVADGGYHPLRNLNRATYAVLADAPCADGHGGGNHGCGGQNVWFEDGHVEYLDRCRRGICDDQLFLNRDGFVGAGIGPDDVVIGAPVAQPIIRPAVRRR